MKDNINYGDALCFVLANTRTRHLVHQVLNNFIPGYEPIDGDYNFNGNIDLPLPNEEGVLDYLEVNKNLPGLIYWNKQTDNPDRIMAGAHFTSDAHLIFSLTIQADGTKEERYFKELQSLLSSEVGVVYYNLLPEFEDGEDFRRKCTGGLW